MTEPLPPVGGSPSRTGRRTAGLGGRHHLTIVAALATLLATAPLLTMFEQLTWLVHSAIAVAAVAGSGAAARSLRAPVWGQGLAMLGALLFVVTFLYRSGEEFLGLLPTTATLEHFGVLLGQVPQVVATEALPVPNHDGLLLLTVIGVGLVAVIVDLLAVGARRPALTGLPMLAIYSVPVAVSHDSVHGATFMIGVVGYLWLIATDNLDRVRRFGRRFTGEGRAVQAWEPSPLAAAGRRLTVIGVLVAVALPLAVPGMTTGLIDRFGSGFPGGGAGSGGGNPTAVNLFAQLDGLLNRDTTVELLQVTTDDPDPFYLRVGTADQITSQGFNHRAPQGGLVSELSGTLIPPSGVSHHRHQATIDVRAWDMNRLPSYQHLSAIEGVGDEWRHDPSQQVVFSDATGASGLSYDLQYVRREYDPAALREAEPLPEGFEIRQQFTEVISEPQVSELVADLTAGVDNPYDQVLAILRHFSTENGFRYSLDTGSETTGSAIVDFLFVNQAGFCVQYAAAMAWMAREAGLPSRVAIGFTRGTPQVDSTYLLTNHHLHAWTEIYFDGFGWVPFDPTPSGSVSGSAQRDWAPDPNAPPDLDSPDGASGPQGTPLPPGDGPDGPAELDEGAGGAVGGLTGEGRSGWQLWLIATLGLIVTLLLAPAVRRLQVRRRRLPSRLAGAVGPPGEDPATGAAPGTVTSAVPHATARHLAHQAWDEFVDTMTDFQVPLDPAETPRGAAERLVRDCRLDQESLEAARGARQLGHAEERARYARVPGSPAGLLVALRSVRRTLASQATRRTRLRAALLPPSTLLRWRNSISEASGRVTNATNQVREALARLSPRRLLDSFPSS